MAGKEPVRTCVGCGARAPKATLLRLRIGPDGVVVLDPEGEGEGAGRGAHVHRTEACLVAAGTPRALGRAFKGKGRAPPEGALLGAAQLALGPLPAGDGPGGATAVQQGLRRGGRRGSTGRGGSP